MAVTDRITDPNLLDDRWRIYDAEIAWIVETHKLPFRRFETLRTKERQKYLYRNGKSKKVLSKHLKGLATDWVPVLDGKWKWHKDWMIVLAYLVRIYMGDKPVRWGGDWDMDSQFWDERFFDGAHYEWIER